MVIAHDAPGATVPTEVNRRPDAGAPAGVMRAFTRPPRVCVVLDNPARDLGGLALVSCVLAARGVEVFVVPMYEQQQHVFRLRPDMVLLNFARQANARLIRRYKAAGIRVGVLDTEGGVLRCEYRELLNIVQNSGVKELIDDYFLWGRRTYEAFSKSLGSGGTALHLTGCPRFDFYSGRRSQLVPEPRAVRPPYVLIATSFPLNNPRFATAEREVDNFIEIMGLERATVVEARTHADGALDAMTVFVRGTVRRFPNMQFVLRPHPFEGERVYVDRLSGEPNLRIERAGEIISWLRHATAILQLNSSVAFEARLLGKPVISLEFLQHPVLAVEIASACSFRSGSPDDCWRLLDHVISGTRDDRMLEREAGIEADVERLVSDWIHSTDGQNCVRVAQVIEQGLARHAAERRSMTAALTARYYHAALAFEHVVKSAVKRVLGVRSFLNRPLKSFVAADLGPVVAEFSDAGVEAVDVPIFRRAAFCRSNAVAIHGRRRAR